MEDELGGVADARTRVVALVDRVADLEVRIAELFAEQVSVLSVLQVDEHVRTEGIDLVDELAPRLRWTSFTAARRLSAAARIAACFPLLWADLAGGEIDYRRVDVVVREAELLDEEQAAVLDAVLAGRLPGLTTAQVTELARREIAAIDTDAVRERARRVVAGRRVGFTALADGAALLEVVGPAPALRAAYDRLDALAKDTSRPGAEADPYTGYPGAPGIGAPAPGACTADVRGVDAKRFDAVVERLMAPVHGAPGTAGGAGPQITIAWPAATGLDDQPARLAGYGAVPAELVRHLLRDQGFRCVATDPVTGHAVHTDGHVHPAGSLPDLRPAPDLRSAAAGVLVASTRPIPAARQLLDDHPGPDAPVEPAPVEPAPVEPASVEPNSAAPHATMTSAPPVGPGAPVAPTVPDASNVLVTPAVGLVPAAPGAPLAPGGRAAPAGSDTTHDPVPPAVDEPRTGGPGAAGVTAAERDGGALRAPDGGHDAAVISADDDPPRKDGSDHPPAGDDDVDRPGGRDHLDPGLLDPFGLLDRRGEEGLDDRESWADVLDPSSPPRDDEFTVTLGVSAFRAATVLNPLRVHDMDAWHRRAGQRARSAVRACPVAADPGHGYRFGAALRRLLLQRSPTCAAPGCRAPSQRCDLDHTVDHALGGPTCPCNAAPLCRRHHTAKHGAGWLVVRTREDPRDPSLTWLSPLGYLYTVPPQPLLPPPARVVVEHVQARRRAAADLERELSLRPPLGLGGGTVALLGRQARSAGPPDPAGPSAVPDPAGAVPDPAGPGALADPTASVDGPLVGTRPAADEPSGEARAETPVRDRGPRSWTPGEDDEPPY